MNALVSLLRKRCPGRAVFSVLLAVAVIGGGSTIGLWHASAIQSRTEQLGGAYIPLARMFVEVQSVHAKEVAVLEQLYEKVTAIGHETTDSTDDKWTQATSQLRQLSSAVTRMLVEAERLDRSANERWLDYVTLIESLSELRLEHERFILHVETVARLVEERRWSELPDTQSDGERIASAMEKANHRVLNRARSAEKDTADASRSHQSILLWNTIALALLAGGALALLVSPRKTRLAEENPVIVTTEPPATNPSASPARSDDPVPSPIRTGDAARLLEGRRILVVDDGPANQRMLASLLKKFGAVVELASHGHQAIDCVNQSKINETPFDTILMDLDMPLLDGMGATAQLREGGCETPIIAVTASENQESRDQCLAGGFDDFFTKPVEKDKLAKAIARQIQRVAEQNPVEVS